MAKMTVTAGLAMRRDFRRELDRLGVAYREDKGWLDSQFVVTADASILRVIQRAIAALDEVEG